MTFTFIIMDSLYIMRNLLMIFFLMVVFWTNLGNCEGSCDKYTQCFLDEARVNSTLSCYVEIAGNTAPPCYGDGSIITCPCNNENYQLSSPDNSYLCKPDEWEDGLYDLQCKASSCDEPAPPDHLVSHSPDLAEGEKYANGTEIMYDCPDGYDLNGNTTAVCINGVWTYEDAYCTDSPCKDPAPANVGVIITPQSVEDDGKSGSRVSYSCPKGYTLNGSRSAVCLYGRWRVETVPSCSATKMIVPSTPESPLQCCVIQFLNGRSSAPCLCVKWIVTTVPRCFAAVVIIAISTLLFVVLLIWLVKKHYFRRGTKRIPSVGDVANEQEPPTANDESKFVSKITFEMRDPNAYQNDVNKEENDVTDHVGDNSPDDSPNNDPKEETV